MKGHRSWVGSHDDLRSLPRAGRRYRAGPGRGPADARDLGRGWGGGSVLVPLVRYGVRLALASVGTVGGMSANILTGDCRNRMAVAAKFDCLIADPPYGDTSLPWDSRVLGWESVAFDALKLTGSLWLFGSMRSLMLCGPTMSAAGFRYAQDCVWEKHNGSGFHADRFKRVHEHVVQFYRCDARWGDVYNEVQTTPDATARTVRRKSRPPHTGKIKGGAFAHYESLDGGPRIMRSVIQIPSCHGHAIHETEKPVDLLQILIRTSCPAGGWVGDFFAGSGAAAEACVALGRNYLGCELDDDMAERARNRSLFVKAATEDAA